MSNEARLILVYLIALGGPMTTAGFGCLGGALITNDAWITALTMLAGAAFGLIAAIVVALRIRIRDATECAGCGYPLAGVQGPRCPECGRPFSQR